MKDGKDDPRKGAHLLAQPCPCGIFNADRCEQILAAGREKKSGGESRRRIQMQPPSGKYKICHHFH
jgi:hypothetical protein